MNINMRLPVANLAGSHVKMAKAVPRTMSASSTKQSSFFGGAIRNFASLKVSQRSQRRASPLTVEAAKKSVGDLSKGDLEGKVVLVRSQTDIDHLAQLKPFHFISDSSFKIFPSEA